MLTVLLKRPSHANSQTASTPTPSHHAIFKKKQKQVDFLESEAANWFYQPIREYTKAVTVQFILCI